MSVHPLAGQPAPVDFLTNIPRLVSEYYVNSPDTTDPTQLVSFGTSGHRGTSAKGSFNEQHILAISQAICEYRSLKGYTGPLFIGMDTHALSEPAFTTAVQVFAANSIEIMIPDDLGFTPTPVVSYAILAYNHNRKVGLADGVIITPSHNPPDDGGFKYNPPSGGPADTTTTKAIQDRANDLLRQGLKGVKRLSFEKALSAPTTHRYDFVSPYVSGLNSIIQIDSIFNSRLKIGVHPLGGACVTYWERIAEYYKLNLTVVNSRTDPTFSFMTLDHDGKIRMDCSSPYAMASLIQLKDQFDIAFANDPDSDRHGIVTPSAGLMNPNHYLTVAIGYLFQNRPGWKNSSAVGKTVVSSSMIDRVTRSINRDLREVPVGFKWFVDGLLDGSLGFGGEESAGASFLRKDGSVWTTDKDGLILNLLAAEITSKTGHDPAEQYKSYEAKFGKSSYARMDSPASPEQKTVLNALAPDLVEANHLAGEPILSKFTRAPSNNAPIGGLKVVTQNGWFAARPSGTENIYKIYAESFKGEDHLQLIQIEAQAIVFAALKKAGV